MSRRFIPFACALVTTLGAASAFAEEEPFGKAGVINVASDLSLSLQSTSFSAPSGGTAPSSVTTYSIGPAADYFVIDNLSVGAQVLFQRTNIEDTKIDTFEIMPRVGYHIPFVPGRFGLWPRVEFGYAASTIKADIAGVSSDETTKNIKLGVFVPLLIHPVEHFHIGIGPYLDTDLTSKTEGADGIKETTIGIRTEIAGWWNL